MIIDFTAVIDGSAFQFAAGRPEVWPGAAGPADAITLVEVADALYVPDALEPGQGICLLQRGVIPVESILDPRTAAFFIEARQQSARAGRPAMEAIESVVLNERACVLGNLFSRNFGHWTEELLKVAVIENLRPDCVYVFAHLPPFARESLELLDIAAARIVDVNGPVRLTCAVFTTAVHHDNIARYPAPLLHLRARLDSKLADRRSRYGERLWLERGPDVRNGGSTRNKPDVYTLLAAHGFDILDPATLGVEEQIVTMRGARVIAGPHGAQFVHAQFMPEHSTVIECFSPMLVNPSILQICRVLHHRYHQVVSRTHFIAPYSHGRDCEIDCEHLELLLDRLAT